MLDIYKASAGSGKTFALTLEYFKIIFANPSEYRNILAVTFTNKATEEMKSRIINELNSLSEGRENAYAPLLKEELDMDDIQLRKRAALLRNMLLHDYGRLAVTTIDRFFQRILKAFTRELGIFPGYNVELDSGMVLEKAVERVMQRLKEKPDLEKWIASLMSRDVEQGKSWGVKAKIADLGAELFRENYMLFDSRVLDKFKDRDFLGKYRNFLEEVISNYEKAQKGKAESALEVIRAAGLQLSDFKSGSRGCASGFYKLADGDFDPPTATVRKGVTEEDSWVTKTSDRKADIESVRSDLMSLLKDIITRFDEEYVYYLSARQVAGNLYQLGILNDLYEEVRGYCEEKGVMLLSDTTHILNLLIEGNDTSFLYEKCGNTYRHLMIDEFQDTSGMQWRNFRPLVVNSLSEGGRSMIVGDVKQSIYRWRNGDWGLLSEGVEEQLGNLGVRNIWLQDNWRSARELVEFNNEFFSRASALLADMYDADRNGNDGGRSQIEGAYHNLEQHPRKKTGGYVDISFLDEKCEETDNEIMDDVVAIVGDVMERGGNQKDIVILVRDGKEGAFIANYLMEYNKTAERPVRFMSNDSLYVASSPYVQFLTALLQYLVEPYDRINKAGILSFYYRYVLEDRNMEYDAVLGGMEEDPFFRKLATCFSGSRGTAPSLYETLEVLIDLFGLKDRESEIPYLIAFQDIVYEYGNNNSNSIPFFLEWWEKEKKNRVLSTSEEVDAVRILTIHKSKGLEFEYVILPFCSWELDSVIPVRRIWCSTDEKGFGALDTVPLNYSSKLADTLFRKDYYREHLKSYIDNLNLLYVALTRPKRELYLRPYMPKRSKDGKIRMGDIGSFVFMVLEQMEPAWESTGAFTRGEKGRLSPTDKESDNLLSLEQYPVWHPGQRISVKFRYRDFAPEEEGRLSAIDEGKLMHEIFRSICTAEDVGNAVRSACMQGLVRREEEEGFRSRIEGWIQAPEVSPWFDGSWKVINEKDILFPEGRKVRPDRVAVREGETLVIDYKFGATEEKSYLRQVGFYCSCLKKMGYKGVKGYIWYVNLGKVVPV